MFGECVYRVWCVTEQTLYCFPYVFSFPSEVGRREGLLRLSGIFCDCFPLLSSSLRRSWSIGAGFCVCVENLLYFVPTVLCYAVLIRDGFTLIFSSAFTGGCIRFWELTERVQRLVFLWQENEPDSLYRYPADLAHEEGSCWRNMWGKQGSSLGTGLHQRQHR